ncbi:hypothetical protein BT69DRAFT_594705 [Atractiella rhizophila]|nr:hypothetical protein BT69DRAFT_594705 [Atractiella rhizophila]
MSMRLQDVWKSYSPLERRNLMIYIAGIMFYKVGLEFFNGSITTLATDRFTAANTFTKLGAAQGVNQAAQCVGSILVAPLIRLFPTRTVLASSVVLFAFMAVLLLVIDAATGGKVKKDGMVRYGDWDPNLLFFIWTVAGVGYGAVELIRRIIPCDIVGGHIGKLRRMDALVHVFYEVSGTFAAFASSTAISHFGNNYSFFITPPCFVLAGVIWFFVSHSTPLNAALAEEEKDDRRRRFAYFGALRQATVGFGESIWVGATLIFTKRRFIWLMPGYALALYLHRFLESTLGPAFAKRELNNSAWSQIITGGSNFGELLGAASVFFLSDYVTTPIPWLRIDALMLNIVWILPHFAIISTPGQVVWAWRAAACFIPISYGWAAGDVSLAAYVQASLSPGVYSEKYPSVSALGAVMAFLYSTYVVLIAIFASVLGKIIDNDFLQHHNIEDSLRRVGGIQFSVCCGIILLSTFIPKGAFSLNPCQIEGVNNNTGEADDDGFMDIPNHNSTYVTMPEPVHRKSTFSNLESIPEGQEVPLPLEVMEIKVVSGNG